MNHRNQSFVHQHFRNAGGVRRESFSESSGNRAKKRLSRPHGGNKRGDYQKKKNPITAPNPSAHIPTYNTLASYNPLGELSSPNPHPIDPSSPNPHPIGPPSLNQPPTNPSSHASSALNPVSTAIGIAALYWCLAGSGCTTIPYEPWEKPARQQILTVPVKEVDPARYRFNVLCLLVGEFSDLATTHWRVKFTPEMGIPDNLEFQEPLEYTLAKRNAVVNPEFTDSSGIDKLVLGRKVNLDFDNVRFETFPHPPEIFEFLKSYRGSSLDRLIIYAHGHPFALGVNRQPQSVIDIKRLLSQYCREDFSHVMKKEGHALLMSCDTLKGYPSTLTFGEVVSWLFQVPVTGATNGEVFSLYSVFTPSMAGTLGVAQHDARMKQWGPDEIVIDLSVPFVLSKRPHCKVEATAPYVTVYPMSDEQLRSELGRKSSNK